MDDRRLAVDGCTIPDGAQKCMNCGVVPENCPYEMKQVCDRAISSYSVDIFSPRSGTPGCANIHVIHLGLSTRPASELFSNSFCSYSTPRTQRFSPLFSTVLQQSGCLF